MTGFLRITVETMRFARKGREATVDAAVLSSTRTGS